MKHSFKKTLDLNLTLDSSEAIMFSKGGKYTINLKPKSLQCDDDDDCGSDCLFPNFSAFDDVNISVQIAGGSMGRFTHITDEAQKHRAQWDEINKKEGRSDPPIPPPFGPITV